MKPRDAHAEVARVDLDDAGIELAGSLVGTTAQTGELVARRRADGLEARAPAQLDGTGFRARIEFEQLPWRDAGEPERWDLFIAAGDAELRLGRHLDDLPDKRHTYVLALHESGGRRFRPFFDERDDLFIRTSPARPHAALPDPTPEIRRRPVATPWELAVNRLVTHAAAALLRRRPAGGSRKVTILLADAYGMGGTVRTCLNIAGYLAQRYDVELISVHRSAEEPFFAFPPDVAVSVVDDRRKRPLHGWRDRVREQLRRRRSVLIFPADFRFRRSCTLWTDVRLLRTLWRIRAGVVMGTRPGLNLLVAALRRPGLAVVGQEHMNLETHTPQRQAAIAARYPALDAIAVLTEPDRATYERLLGDRVRIEQIPNAVPALAAAPAALERPLIVAAGRLTLQKGFDRLLPAFAQVAARHPEWTLRICGGGPQRAALSRQILDLGLHNNAFLLGPVDRLDLQMAQASMYVLSSRYEGLPMVMIEAMSLGLPVVGFDCPTGPRDVIGGERGGLLVPDGDIQALAAAMLALVEDSARRRALGAAAIVRAQDYALASIGPRWEALVDGLSAA